MIHSLHPLHRCAAAVFAAALLPGVSQAAPSPSPVRELSTVESAVAQGLPYTTGASLALRVASAVKVSAYSQGVPKQDVSRQSGSNAAVYRSLPQTSPAKLPTPPAPGELFDFTVQGDSVQAWATMTAEGVPHLLVRGFGDFRADASASWTATVTLPATSSKEVVLRFVIPQASVSGNTEQQGPAWWRSSLRAELLVNGFPAWSTAALRLRADYKSGSQTVPLVVLQQFGQALDFPTNDEDSSASNDSGPSPDSPSQKKIVYLSLGRHDAGTQLQLSMTVRGSTFTLPTGASTDNRCQQNAVQFFCSRASMSVSGGTTDGPRVYLMP